MAVFSNSGKRPAAFTLVEVLVALTIFSLAAVVLGATYLNVLNSYSLVTRGVAASDDLAFARAQVLLEPDRTKLEKGGEFDSTHDRHVRWSVEIASTNTADLFSVVFTCEFTHPAQTKPHTTTQTFQLLRPTWTIDAAERSKLKETAKTRILELQGKKTP